MTKKLEELLNLPETRELVKEQNAASKIDKKEKIKSSVPAENFFKSIDEFDKISSALPQVNGLGDLSDTEFDELAKRATDAYDDLMDLGMNVEPRYSSRIFEVAGTMLKNAIDAKAAKIDKKLKMVELQLKKHKIDQDSKGKSSDDPAEGEGFLITDRNSLLEKLKNIK